MHNIFYFITLFYFLSTPLYAQQPSVDNKDLKAIVKELTSKPYEGRMVGSSGQKRAADFIAAKYKELGLDEVEEQSYYQRFNVIKSYWGDVYIEVEGKRLNNFNEMAYLASSGENLEVDNEVIFGGDGSVDFLDQIDIEDKVVLIFLPNMRASWDVEKTLLRKGAFAVIYANPTNSKQFESMRNSYREFHTQEKYGLERTRKRTLGPIGRRLDTIKHLPKFIISNEQIKTLTGLSSKKLQKLIIFNEPSVAPLKTIKIKLESKREIIETENIIGRVNGKIDSTIIISAHYDHLGVKEKKLYPGADDNASGTAALLELAEYFSAKILNYNLIFLATTAEEEGLLGSRYFVNSDLFDSASTILNINLDMIGRSDDISKKTKNYLYCIGTYANPQYAELIKMADNDYINCSLNYFYDNPELYSRSDQYSFYKKSIPAIMFFSGLHDDYHMPSDTFEKIDYRLLQNRVQLIESIISQIQKSYGIK